MRYDWIIIDGFSVLHRCETLAVPHRAGRLFEARRLLMQRIDRVAGVLADRVTLVFDGRREGGPGEEAFDVGIEVLFSPGHLTADSVIERLAHESRAKGRLLVVTSDRLERETVDGAGAETMSSGDFLAWCEREEQGLARRESPRPPSGGPRSPRGATLGDFFPTK